MRIVTDTGVIEIARDEVSYDLAIGDVRDVNVSKADATRTFTIEATRANLKVFGYSDLLEFAPDAPSVKVSARLELAGMTVARGWLRVVQVSGTSIDVMFMGGNGDLLLALDGGKLTDLDFSDAAHGYNAAAILDSWANFDSRAYIYPVVDYGGDGTGLWRVADFRLAVKAREVIERMIKSHGWTLQSSFMSGDYFSRLYLLGGNVRDLPESYLTSREFEAVTSADVSWTVDNGPAYPVFNTAVVAAGNYSTTTGLYTFDFSFRGGFTSVVSLQYEGGGNQADTMGVRLRILKNGGIIGETNIDIPLIYNSVTADPFTVSVTATEQDFMAGDVVRVELDGACNDLLRQYLVTGGASFLNWLVPVLLPGAPVDPALFLPENSQLEFLQALRHKSCLQVWANAITRTVYIEPFDDFYGQPDTAVDWTGKIRGRDKVTISSPQPDEARLIMGWSTDGDYHVGLYKGGLPFAAGSYEFDTPGGRDDRDENCQMFAPTYMAACPRRWIHERIPVIWMQEPDEVTGIPDQDFDHAPRLLYFDGMKSPASYFVEYIQQSEVPGFLAEGMDELMDRYYRRSLYIIDKAHTVRMPALLTEVDLLNLDPRKLVKVENVYYLLNQVVGWQEDGSCEIELVQWKAKGKAQGKTITGNVIPPPHGKVKPTVGVYMMDYRFRPPQLLPVMTENEDGTITQVEVLR